jgi:hypothetical protein
MIEAYTLYSGKHGDCWVFLQQVAAQKNYKKKYFILLRNRSSIQNAN